MPALYSPILWWVERDPHGRKWPIFLTSDELTTGMAGNMGLTFRDPNIREIHIWAGQSRNDMLDTALHEVMHACLSRSDLRCEEQAISTITPRILPSLRRNGWSPPPLPHGWRSLAAHARWIRYGSLQRDPDNE